MKPLHILSLMEFSCYSDVGFLCIEFSRTVFEGLSLTLPLVIHFSMLL